MAIEYLILAVIIVAVAVIWWELYKTRVPKLGDFAVNEVNKLRKLHVGELRSLPACEEREIEVDGKVVNILTFRDDSHDERITVIVMAFTGQTVSTWCAGDGFAITKDDEIVALDEVEESTM